MSEIQDTETSLSPEELNNIVNDTVVYILHDEKVFSLIKRQDIVKNILKGKKNDFVQVMMGVKTRLLETLNFELIDIEPNKKYALVNRLHSKKNIFSREIEADRTLIILVLTLIFMNRGVMTESVLFNVLTRLRIMNSKQDKKHEIFGFAEAAIKKKYIQWGYLDWNVIPESDPAEYEFKWGKRAEEQVCKKAILEFACKVLGETEPIYWDWQYVEAKNQAVKTSK